MQHGSADCQVQSPRCRPRNVALRTQVRWGRKPDGVCLVVGACCRGFDPAANTTGDVIFTNQHSQPAAANGGSGGSGGSGGGGGASSSSSGSGGVTNAQYFWEAFPAGTDPRDRTTYMFTYVDADPRRPSVRTPPWLRGPGWGGGAAPRRAAGHAASPRPLPPAAPPRPSWRRCWTTTGA